MASDQAPSDVINILPQVYELLLDHEQDIQDDTWLEKLLSWFQESFSSKEGGRLLEFTGVFSFLQSASTSGQGSCLSFALRVLPCTASYIESRRKSTYNHHRTDQNGDQLYQNTALTLEELLHTGQALLERGCMNSSDMSVTYAWITAVAELVNIEEWRPILEDVEAVTVAIDLLNDHESMFVVHAAEQFLASVLLVGESCGHSIQLNQVEEDVTKTEQEDKSNMEDVEIKRGLQQDGDDLIQKWHRQVINGTTGPGRLSVFIELLKKSGPRGLRLLKKMDITDSLCASLSDSATAVKAADLIIAQLEIIAQMSVVQKEEYHEFITSVIKATADLVEKPPHWIIVCQLMPPLCTFQRKWLHKDMKESIGKVFSSVLATLSDGNQTGKSIRVQQFLRSNALRCLDKAVCQGSGSLEGFTKEVMASIQSHFDWISLHCCGSGRNLMAGDIKQTFDVVTNLIDAGDIKDEDWLTGIVHRVLNIISTANCDNTILNKGLGIMKAFLQSHQGDDGLLLALKNVLEKHLVSFHWGNRDTSLQFIGTLIEIPNAHLRNWLIETRLHLHIWASLEDEENYVRQTALNSLGCLVRNKAILTDFMMQENLSKMDITRKVTAIICQDTGGFARRAAMRLLCDWFRDDISLLISPEGTSSDQDSSNIAETVFSAVTAATRDFDWEVKLLALQFWEKFLVAVIPGLTVSESDAPKNPDSQQRLSENHSDALKPRNEIPPYATNLIAGKSMIEQGVNMGSSNPDHPLSVTGSDGPTVPDKSTKLAENCARAVTSRELPGYTADHKAVDSPNKKMKTCNENGALSNGVTSNGGWVHLLKEHVCLSFLLEKLTDEDAAVCQRSCKILINLRDRLDYLRQSAQSPSDCECPAVAAEIQRIVDKIQASDIDSIHRTLDCDPDNIAILLEDIVMVAHRDKKIAIDCY